MRRFSVGAVVWLFLAAIGCPARVTTMSNIATSKQRKIQYDCGKDSPDTYSWQRCCCFHSMLRTSAGANWAATRAG